MTKQETKKTAQRPRFLWGFVAGVVGGVAGTMAKVIAERVYSPEEPEPVAERGVLPAGSAAAPHWLDRTDRGAAGPDAHWTIGALAGGVYGMLAEVWPQVTEGNGTAFGMAVNFALHGDALPLLAAPPKDAKGWAREKEITTHAVFGVTAEFVRRHTRSWLERREAGRRRDVSVSDERRAA
jgi:uncharacterized membrane protein YagU involved in acid resistance